MKRREFIKIAGLLGAGMSVPFLWQHWSEVKALVGPDMDEQWETIERVQAFLLPEEPDSPGAGSIKALPHLQWTLLDPNFDTDIKDAIVEGYQTFARNCLEQTGQKFTDLSTERQFEFMQYAAGQRWGERWFSRLLTYIFEALLGDPVYGINPDGIGWQWLQHKPGAPRPTLKEKYDYASS
jgi:gluconate 2-dehydrogenase gamma chain